MNIVIVEDEALVARRIERLTKAALGSKIASLQVKPTLDEASACLFEQSVDLLLLDLNLNGRDGFQLLTEAASGAFQTIVISANIDKALEAFEYGVLDFVAKPFTVERLQKAFQRYETIQIQAAHPTRYLSIRKNNRLQLIDIEQIRYIQGSGIYAELHLMSAGIELHNKTLSALEKILPSHFLRIHKSFIVNLKEVRHFRSHGASKYDLELNNGQILPVSRSKYKRIKHNFS